MTSAYDTASDRTLWQQARHWAAVRGSEPVIVEHAGGITWQRYVDETENLRSRLAAIGVQDQRTAVLALPNASLTLGLWLAIIANGAIVQAIDVESGPVVFERAIRATNPVVVFACPENAKAASEGMSRAESSARLVVVEHAELDGRYDRLGLTATASVPADATADLVAGMLPTSGTSGMPKLVQLTQRNYVMAGERLARNGGFLAEDRHYLCTPFFHTNGQLYLAVPPFITGGSIALVPRFSASEYFATAAKLGVTVSSMVAPPMRLALHKAVERGGPVNAGDLRLIQYGMTLSSADWQEWDRLVPQIHMRQIYGQTESVTGVLGGSPWETDDRHTIGRPFIGVPGVRLVGDDGSDVPDGEPGELWVRGEPGSTLMLGYHDAPEATAQTLVDGQWLRTGDIMVREPGGRIAFRGRRMHIIRRGGENLSTYALEVDLQACPLVSDVAVTAKEDDRLDALVVAHVIPDAGFTEQGFLDWCRENLGKRGVPDEVRVHSSFPRTGSGRVIARELG